VKSLYESILSKDYDGTPEYLEGMKWFDSWFTHKGLKLREDGTWEADQLICRNYVGLKKFPDYIHVSRCGDFGLDGVQQWTGETWPDQCDKIYLNGLYHLRSLKGIKCNILVISASRPPETFGLKRGDVNNYRLASHGLYDYKSLEQKFIKIGAKSW
jgi:hypothetical protein